MKNRVLYGLRLSAAIIIFILAAAGGIGIFYPVRIFDIQFLPLLQRVLTDFSIAALILCINCRINFFVFLDILFFNLSVRNITRINWIYQGTVCEKSRTPAEKFSAEILYSRNRMGNIYCRIGLCHKILRAVYGFLISNVALNIRTCAYSVYADCSSYKR